MRDSSSADLLAEFDRKRKRLRLAPGIAALGVLLLVGLFVGDAPAWVIIAAAVVALVAFVVTLVRDQLRKTVVLFYELTPDAEQDYQALHDAMQVMRACARCWHVEAEGDVVDRKRNAGASGVVRRKGISLSTAPPPFVKANIEVPSIPVGRQTLYFFPDRVLVFEPSGVGAVPYTALEVARSQTRFVERSGVPKDATVVDRTWQYVNKKGGPDRRFKDNKELPIALYEDIHLTSATGLNELFQLSRVDAAREFQLAIDSMARGTVHSD